MKQDTIPKAVCFNGSKFLSEPTNQPETSLAPHNTRDLTKKREDYLEWSEYFMGLAFLSAMRSKDPVSQVSW